MTAPETLSDQHRAVAELLQPVLNTRSRIARDQLVRDRLGITPARFWQIARNLAGVPQAREISPGAFRIIEARADAARARR
ncbi:DUF3263 domain-containing protein [Streptacidiphilus cavernicola]|uniref:DUF3263 domain-containing protein n=1 Tax=Streptacidiphilus cavernicola TaxID=3342716 RepID=A0ABV6VY25_9ACTN